MMNPRWQTVAGRIRGAAALTAVGLTLVQGAAADPGQQCLSVDLGPAREVASGPEFVIPVRLVSELGGESLFSFQGRLQWDSAVLTADPEDEEPGKVLMDGWVLQLDLSEPGVLVFVAYSEDNKLTQAGLDQTEGVLVEFNLMAISGSSVVSLSEFMFNEGSPCSVTASTTVTPARPRTWGSLKTRHD